MKHLAALAAIVLPASAQAVSQTSGQGEIIYECQITEACKSSGCNPLDPIVPVTLKQLDGQSKGTILSNGQEYEAHVLRGLGAQEFLQITAGGSIGYTVQNESGELSVRATGGQQRHERGVCSISQ